MGGAGPGLGWDCVSSSGESSLRAGRRDCVGGHGLGEVRDDGEPLDMHVDYQPGA